MELHAALSTDADTTRTEIAEPAELLDLVGQPLGTTPWVEVSQADVNDFARVTRDEQWIHVDKRRAAEGPFGSTIAHGFFVLSLCAYFSDAVLRIGARGMSINYGLDRVRFTSPVPVGSRVRAHINLASATAIEGGVHFTQTITVERDGQRKPVCIATTVARVYGRGA
jgi:acyl dehydratase